MDSSKELETSNSGAFDVIIGLDHVMEHYQTLACGYPYSDHEVPNPMVQPSRFMCPCRSSSFSTLRSNVRVALLRIGGHPIR